MYGYGRAGRHPEKRDQILRRMWLSPLAALVLPLGALVAFALRDRKLITDSVLGWLVLALPILAVFLIGLIGFRAHEKLAQINGGLSSNSESGDTPEI